MVCGVAGFTNGRTPPTVTDQIDVEFRTEAARDYLIRLRLVDADGNTEDVFESGFPPDQQGAPSYSSAGLSNGPYTVTLETETERERFEWSTTDCPRLVVDVTVLADGQLEIERTWSTP